MPVRNRPGELTTVDQLVRLPVTIVVVVFPNADDDQDRGGRDPAVVLRNAAAHGTVLLEQPSNPLSGLPVSDDEQPLTLAEAGAGGTPNRSDDPLDRAARDGLRLVRSNHAPPSQDVPEVHRARIRRVIRRRITVRGRVQGVFFRDSMQRLARQRNVSGWVSNRADGAVEAELEGDEEAVERLVDFARRGPRGAQVESVEVVEEEPEGLSGFSVR